MAHLTLVGDLDCVAVDPVGDPAGSLEGSTIDRRVTYLLRLCDRDHDDLLDVADVEDWVDRLAALRGWEPGSGGYAALLALFVDEGFGGLQSAGARRDGRMTVVELRDALLAMARVCAPEMLAWADALFDVLDRSRDGIIGREEHRDLLASLNVDRASADASFARIDVEGSGRLTRADFAALYLQFFLDEDPDAVAGWFWGPPAFGPKRTGATRLNRLSISAA